MLKSFLYKTKTLSLYSIKELGAIFAVALKLKPISRFNLGIFESRVIFEGLINQGIIVQREDFSTCRINLGENKKVLVRKQSSDARVFEQVYIKKEYYDFINLIKSKSTDYRDIKYIIDAGANVGYATMYFLQYFPQAQVICIEPEDGNYDLLQRNLAVNRLNHVRAIKAGLWNKDSNLIINTATTDTREWSFSVREATSDEVHSIDGVSISTILSQNNMHHIDILKIDIEGAEKYLFADTQSAEFFLKKTRFIAIEIHESMVDKSLIIDLLRRNSFAVSESGEYTVGINLNYPN